MTETNRLVTSDPTPLQAIWGILVVVFTIGVLWEDFWSLSWVGRAVLIGALVAFGVVDTFLIPRLRSRTFMSMGITAGEMAVMVLLALVLARFGL